MSRALPGDLALYNLDIPSTETDLTLVVRTIYIPFGTDRVHQLF